MDIMSLRYKKETGAVSGKGLNLSTTLFERSDQGPRAVCPVFNAFGRLMLFKFSSAARVVKLVVKQVKMRAGNYDTG